jgi:hypothetical protein
MRPAALSRRDQGNHGPDGGYADDDPERAHAFSAAFGASADFDASGAATFKNSCTR